MISKDDYYVIVARAVCSHSGISQEEVRRRLFKPSTKTLPALEYRPGQKTQLEDDGCVKWTVTLTNNLAPDGDKKVAFVVRWLRYQEEQGIKREPFAFNRRRR